MSLKLPTLPQPSFHKQEIIMMRHLSKEGYNSNINDKYSSYFVMTMHQGTILVRMKYDYQYSDTHDKNRERASSLH